MPILDTLWHCLSWVWTTRTYACLVQIMGRRGFGVGKTAWPTTPRLRLFGTHPRSLRLTSHAYGVARPSTALHHTWEETSILAPAKFPPNSFNHMVWGEDWQQVGQRARAAAAAPTTFDLTPEQAGWSLGLWTLLHSDLGHMGGKRRRTCRKEGGTGGSYVVALPQACPAMTAEPLDMPAFMGQHAWA